MAKRRPQKSKHARHPKKSSKSFNAWANSVLAQNPSANMQTKAPVAPISNAGASNPMVLPTSVADMLRQYDACLGYHSQYDLRKLDIIDMQHLFTHIAHTDQPGDCIARQTAQLGLREQEHLKDYVNNHAWLATLPCTPEGIVRLENTLTYFSFDRLSLEDQQIDLHLTKWTALNHDIPVYHYDIYVTVDFAVNGWRKPFMMFMPKSRNALQINNNHRVFYECKWDKSQTLLWATIVDIAKSLVQNEKDSFCHMQQRCTTEHPELYYEVMSFLQNMAIANSVMAMTNKPSIHPAPTGHRAADTAIAMGVDQKPVTLIQHFGNLVVTARHTVSPIRFLPTLISYTQDQWQVRGHIRTYKDGHSVYVKPHINRRHGVPESDNAEQSQKIRILQ